MLRTCPNCCADLVFPEGRDKVRCRFCRRDIPLSVFDRPDSAVLEQADRLCNQLHFREARALYEQVLLASPDSVRAMWGLLKASYGVEIVCEDRTGDRFVICHKRNREEIYSLPVYRRLLSLVHGQEKEQLEADAAFIQDKQNAISALASHGTQYDVYLCYKESGLDRTGESSDHGWAKEVYTRLRALLPRDVSIFYAPESLYGQAGASYAAGIAYALSTSRVMVLLCSQPGYLETTWVKNEWEQFLHYITGEKRKRRLIPVCRSTSGMGPEQFPRSLLALHTQIVDFDADPTTFYQQTADQVLRQLSVPDPSDPYRRPPFEKQLSQLREEHEKLKDAFQTLTAEKTSLLSALDQKEETLHEIRGQRESDERERKKLELKLETMQDQLDHYWKEWKLEEAHREELEDQLALLRVKLAGAQKELEEMRVKAADPGAFRKLSEEKEQLARQCRSLQAELDAARKKAADPEAFRKLTEEKEHLARQCRDLQAELDAARKRSRDPEAAVSVLTRERDLLAAHNRKLEAERVNTEGTIGFLKQQYQKTSEDLKNLRGQLSERERETERLKSDLSALEAENTGLLKKLRTPAAPAGLDMATVQTSFLQLEAAQTQLQEKVQQTRQENIRLQQENSRLLNELSAWKGKAENAPKQYVGKCVPFGFFQKTTLSWYILSVSGNSALLLSRDVVWTMPYHEKWMAVSWENSDVRKWLRQTFYYQAFSPSERKNIQEVQHDSRDPHGAQNKVSDSVFLLSEDEVMAALSPESARKAGPLSPNVSRDSFCRWWLRTACTDTSRAPAVDVSGKLIRPDVNSSCFIRPALSVSLNALPDI